MGVGSGDRLARGAHRASYGNSSITVSQQKWNDIFGEASGPVQKQNAAKKTSKKTKK